MSPPVAPVYGLDGRVVVLTGAAGGIGQALAAAFAAQGCKIVLLDRNAERLSSLVDSLTTAYPVIAVPCDLNDDRGTAELAKTLSAQLVQVDILVNNAGSEYPTPLADTSDNAMTRWASLLDNNVTSMVRLTRALLPLLPPGASIINQSSIWGQTGVADFSAYVASKHAVIGLTRSLAWELAPRSIRVNAVCPGWIRTDAALASLHSMAKAQSRSAEEVEREILSKQAMPGMLDASDIAGVYLFLASSDARALTGQSLVASNGEVMH
jgi:3-hydroxybutyrate dehydrogenase